MSFHSEIYPYRQDRREFPRRLLQKIDSEFTEIVAVPGELRRRDIGGRRCQVRLNEGPIWRRLTGTGEVRTVCDYSATITDKKVVKALLNGWTRSLSDRYLDFQTVRSFERRRFRSIDEAYETIRRNHPQGAVKFIYNEIPANNESFPLFGPSIPADMSYNRYFSQLLVWDDRHCFGLVMELTRLNNLLQLGGGSTVHPALQAACEWIFRNQRENPRSIYHFVAS